MRVSITRKQMVDLMQIVNSLEDKIDQLLQKQERLELKNSRLEEDLLQQEAEKKQLKEKIESINRENQSLKTANAMLGSKEFKRDTKLKINSLIREIDQCIVQLSE